MNSLDSPLEALALNYLSYGFLTAVNSVWTWIAVITAAVSFWKIKSSSPTPLLPTPDPRCMSQDGASTSSTPLKIPSPRELDQPAVTAETNMHLERQGSTKVKFRVYYEEDDDFREGDDASENYDDGGERAASEKLRWWCEDRERMWDMGWYRCQDLTVLDGSVVRLWDGRRRRRAAVVMVNGGATCY